MKEFSLEIAMPTPLTNATVHIMRIQIYKPTKSKSPKVEKVTLKNVSDPLKPLEYWTKQIQFTLETQDHCLCDTPFPQEKINRNKDELMIQTK